MAENGILLRTARPDDAPRLLEIYRPYVEKTAISFECEVPSLEEFRGRIVRTLKNHPYFTVERGGELLGYAYTGSFVGRAAYSWAAEVTIYLREDQRRNGLGRRLYGAIEAASRARNIFNLNACIGVPEGQEDLHLNRNSMEFHAHMGYRLVGEFRRCGYKFGTWYNMIWMEKLLGQHPVSPKPVIPFSELEPELLRNLLDGAIPRK